MNRFFAAASAIAMLSGCVSLVPEQEAPGALYRIGPIAEATEIKFTRSILIRQPEAPRILSSAEISARDAKGSIRLVKGAEWADRPTRMMQLALLDYIGAGHGGAALAPNTGARAEFELSWRLSEFALEGNLAIARAELTLLDGRTRSLIRQLTVNSQVEAINGKTSSRALALSEAGREIVRSAGRFIAETMTGDTGVDIDTDTGEGSGADNGAPDAETADIVSETIR